MHKYVLITWKFVWLFKISENHKKGHEWPNFSGSTYFLNKKRLTLLKIKGSIFIISYDVKENNTKRAIKAVKRLKCYMVWSLTVILTWWQYYRCFSCVGWWGTTSTQIHSLDLKLILRDLNWVKVMLQTATKKWKDKKSS